jgi:hypothetical protein
MNQEKFRELVVYISARSDADPRFGAVKLNKILYYADFTAYRRLRRALTEDEYQNLPEGPAPRHLLGVRESLVSDGSVRIETHDHHGYAQTRIVANRQAAQSLTADERTIVDEVIDELWFLNGTEVAARSHKEFGWQVTGRGETIPYRTAWISSEPLTARQIAFGQQVARRLGLLAG